MERFRRETAANHLAERCRIVLCFPDAEQGPDPVSSSEGVSHRPNFHIEAFASIWNRGPNAVSVEADIPARVIGLYGTPT